MAYVKDIKEVARQKFTVSRIRNDTVLTINKLLEVLRDHILHNYKDNIATTLSQFLCGDVLAHAIATSIKATCQHNHGKRMLVFNYTDDDIFIIAVLEYITMELIEQGERIARNNKKIFITSDHINTGIKEDPELKVLLTL